MIRITTPIGVSLEIEVEDIIKLHKETKTEIREILSCLAEAFEEIKEKIINESTEVSCQALPRTGRSDSL